VRFEVFTVNIHVEVFWVVTQCSVVVGCHCFKGSCCIYRPGVQEGKSRGLATSARYHYEVFDI